MSNRLIRFRTVLTFVVISLAALLAGCGPDATTPDAEQLSKTAAKPLKTGISVERLKSPRPAVRPDGRLVEKRVHVYYRTGFEAQGELPGGESGGGHSK